MKHGGPTNKKVVSQIPWGGRQKGGSVFVSVDVLLSRTLFSRRFQNNKARQIQALVFFFKKEANAAKL